MRPALRCNARRRCTAFGIATALAFSPRKPPLGDQGSLAVGIAELPSTSAGMLGKLGRCDGAGLAGRSSRIGEATPCSSPFDDVAACGVCGLVNAW